MSITLRQFSNKKTTFQAKTVEVKTKTKKHALYKKKLLTQCHAKKKKKKKKKKTKKKQKKKKKKKKKKHSA